MTLEDGSLYVEDVRYNLSDYDRVILVGAGKASVGMVEGVLAVLGDDVPCRGQIVTKYEHAHGRFALEMEAFRPVKRRTLCPIVPA